MPRSRKPPGQLGKEVEILPGTKCVFFSACVGEFGDSVGVQELVYSQRGKQWAEEFMCSQDNENSNSKVHSEVHSRIKLWFP